MALKTLKQIFNAKQKQILIVGCQGFEYLEGVIRGFPMEDTLTFKAYKWFIVGCQGLIQLGFLWTRPGYSYFIIFF